MFRRPEHLLDGTPAVELVPALGAEPGDLVSPRRHGVSPFTGTSLDTRLRSLGVRRWWPPASRSTSASSGSPSRRSTSATGWSSHRDAVAGLPPSYADALLANTFPLISTLTTVDDVIRAWEVAREGA